MGLLRLRFTAQEEGGSALSGRIGWGHSLGAMAGPQDNSATRHPPIALYKGDQLQQILFGVSSEAANSEYNVMFLTSDTLFADYGFSDDGGFPVLSSSELLDRFAIEFKSTAGAVVQTLLNSELAADFETVATSQRILVGNAVSEQLLKAEIEMTPAAFTALVSGTTYDMFLTGDFDRACIVDWRGIQNGFFDLSSLTIPAGNGFFAGIADGQTVAGFPQLKATDGVNWDAADGFADVNELITSSFIKGTIGSGSTASNWTSGEGVYSRVHQVFNEDGTVKETKDAAFNSVGLQHAWGVFEGYGVDPEQYIYVNGNVPSTGDLIYRDGTSEHSGYASTDDIPAIDLTDNRLVYIVAGTVVDGITMSEDTILVVNNGQLALASGGGNGVPGVVGGVIGHPIT